MVTIRVPKYRVRPDRNVAFVEVFGRRITLPGLPNSAESIAEYHRIIQEASAAKLAKEKPKFSVDLSVMELVTQYLSWAKVYYSRDNNRRGSEYGNVKDAVFHLLKLYGDTFADDFGPLALADVRDSMIANGLCRSTINARVHRIRRAFRWAVSKQIIPADIVQSLDSLAPLRKGKSAAKEPLPVKPVEIADVEAVLPHLTQLQADMVGIHLLTGMRSENLCCLRFIDIDQSGDVWLYRPPQHKGSHLERNLTIPLGPKCQAIIRKYDATDPNDYIFSPRESERQRRAAQRIARKTPMTPSQAARRPKPNPKPNGRKGMRYTQGTYRQFIIRGIEKLNEDRAANNLPKMEQWHPHQIRHTVGTQIREKYKAEAARVFLGHSRLSVTEIYAERDLGIVLQIAREIG